MNCHKVSEPLFLSPGDTHPFSVILILIALGLTNIDLGRGVAWEKEFLDHLNAARVRYEEMKTTDLGSELRKALEDVLLKGVDVRSRQITLANAY